MKVASRDYKMFVRCCKEWQQKLGVKDWSVHYTNEHIDESYARTYTNHEAHVATIVLSDYWDDLRPKTDREINRLALHETLHLLMNPLTDLAITRFTSQNEIETAEHRIIRQLENIIV